MKTYAWAALVATLLLTACDRPEPEWQVIESEVVRIEPTFTEVAIAAERLIRRATDLAPRATEAERAIIEENVGPLRKLVAALNEGVEMMTDDQSSVVNGSARLEVKLAPLREEALRRSVRLAVICQDIVVRADR